MKDHVINIIGSVLGVGTWALLQDLGLAIVVALVTGYVAKVGGHIASKHIEKIKNRKENGRKN